jgi:hypothetical protein
MDNIGQDVQLIATHYIAHHRMRCNVGRWIVLLSAIYLAAALAFGAYEASQNPLWRPDTRTMGEVVGAGLIVYVASAIVPMIGWGFARFRQHAARPVFLAWLLLGLAVAYFADAGKRIDRRVNLANVHGNSAFSPKEREDFEQSVKAGCQQTQRADPLTVKIGISEAKITVYCECIAAGLAEAINLEELRYAVTNGKPPASLVEKRTTMAQFCSQEALRN